MVVIQLVVVCKSPRSLKMIVTMNDSKKRTFVVQAKFKPPTVTALALVYRKTMNADRAAIQKQERTLDTGHGKE